MSAFVRKLVGHINRRSTLSILMDPSKTSKFVPSNWMNKVTEKSKHFNHHERPSSSSDNSHGNHTGYARNDIPKSNSYPSMTNGQAYWKDSNSNSSRNKRKRKDSERTSSSRNYHGSDAFRDDFNEVYRKHSERLSTNRNGKVFIKYYYKIFDINSLLIFNLKQ